MFQFDQHRRRGTYPAPPLQLDILDQALKRYPIILVVVFSALFVLFKTVVTVPSMVGFLMVFFGTAFLTGVDQAHFLWRRSGRVATGVMATNLAMLQAACGILLGIGLALLGAVDGRLPASLPGLWNVTFLCATFYFIAARAGIAAGARLIFV